MQKFVPPLLMFFHHPPMVCVCVCPTHENNLPPISFSETSESNLRPRYKVFFVGGKIDILFLYFLLFLSPFVPIFPGFLCRGCRSCSPDIQSSALESCAGQNNMLREKNKGTSQTRNLSLLTSQITKQHGSTLQKLLSG